MEIEHLLDRAMTVGELKEILSHFHDDYKVLITSNYGDRGQTEQVHTFDSNDIDEIDNDQELAETGYSATGVRLRSNDEILDKPEDERGPRNIVLIRV